MPHLQPVGAATEAGPSPQLAQESWQDRRPKGQEEHWRPKGRAGPLGQQLVGSRQWQVEGSSGLAGLRKIGGGA